jgi:transglutaminase-like putative cysteine protease
MLRVVTLIGVDLAAVAVLLGLFQDPAPWSLLATVVVSVHLVSALCRVLRIPLVVVVSRELFAVTLTGGLVPTSSTLEVARTALTEARTTYGSVVAPVVPLTGFVLLAAAATWIVAATSDLVAFPGAARLEALVPGAAMVLFGSALRPDGRTGAGTVVFAAAAAACVAASRSEEVAADPWLDGPSAHGRTRTAAAAAAALFVTVATVGVAYEAADDRLGEGSMDWRGGSAREIDRRRADRDPMVTVRSRLVDQSEREMFRSRTVVSGPRFDLWRQRTLERFDGTSWSAASEPDPTATGAGAATAEVEITVGALRGSAVPIPGYVLAVLDSDGNDTRLAGVDTRSEDAIAPNGLRSDDRWRIRWVPRPSIQELGGARTPELFSLTSREVRRLTTVPLPEVEAARLRALAVEVTAGAADPVEQAAMLNRWFLASFTYDLGVVRSGEATASVIEFVMSTRRGYCEQFASAYAAMARLLGIPARVVVGFARGVPRPDGSEVVQGRHAHAWVEVFVPGSPGWVTVDPTPGQGLNSTAERPADVAVTTAPPTTAPPESLVPPTTVAAPIVEPNTAERTDSRAGRPLRAAATVALLVAGVLAATALSRRGARALRGPRGPSAAAAAERRWLCIEDTVSWVGARRRADESAAAFARRCRRDGVVGEPTASDLVDAATLIDQTRYGPVRGGGDPAGLDAAGVLPVLERTIRSTLPVTRRAAQAVWPLPWRPRRAGRGGDDGVGLDGVPGERVVAGDLSEDAAEGGEAEPRPRAPRVPR